MSEKLEVKVGQVYRDKDKRMSSGGRYIVVVAMNSGRLVNKALCFPCFADGRWINTNGTLATRHMPKNLQTRFELVKDVKE